VSGNNHPNFGAKGSMVAGVPPGTGMMVMATDEVEVFKNTIENNQTCSLAVVSYYITNRPLEEKDKGYDPIAEGGFIHNNHSVGGGDDPKGEFGRLFGILLGKPIPDIVYDGIINPKKLVDGQLPAALRLVIKDNRKKDGAVTFANLKLAELGNVDPKKPLQALGILTRHKPKVERDLTPYAGQFQPLPPVQLPGMK